MFTVQLIIYNNIPPIPCEFPALAITHSPLIPTIPLTYISLGIAVRLWQLGIEMRPLFNRESLWVYPLFAGVGGSFGYWMQGVESRQLKILAERKNSLLEKRKRRAEREAQEGVGMSKAEEGGILASTS